MCTYVYTLNLGRKPWTAEGGGCSGARSVIGQVGKRGVGETSAILTGMFRAESRHPRRKEQGQQGQQPKRPQEPRQGPGYPHLGSRSSRGLGSGLGSGDARGDARGEGRADQVSVTALLSGVIGVSGRASAAAPWAPRNLALAVLARGLGFG
jgi:hypothetical protein